MAQIRVLSPVGRVAAAGMSAPALPRDWTGRTVGFLDNTKSNFDLLTARMGDLLRDRLGVTQIVHRRKANASTAASADLVAELVKTCDVVFAGSAD